MDRAAAGAGVNRRRTMERFLESFYRLAPVTATFTGIHDHDSRLPDWSPSGIDAAVSEMRAMRSALRTDERVPAEPRARASVLPAREQIPQRIDRTLASTVLDIQIAEMEGRHFHRGNPALFTGEAIFGILALVTGRFAPAAQRLAATIARLQAIPRFLEGARATLGSHPIPEAWIERALRECEGAHVFLDRGIAAWLRECRRTPPDAFVQGALPDAARAPREKRDVLERQAHAAARGAQAGFDDFARWLRRDVVVAPAHGGGCGGDMFDLLMTRGHGIVRSRDDLRREARTRLDEASEQLTSQAGEWTSDGWPGVQAMLAEHHPTATDYVAAHERTWSACQELAERSALLTWPDAPVRYRFIPGCVREAAPYLYYLLYRSPPPGDALATHEALLPPVETTMPATRQAELLRANHFGVIKLNHVVHHGAIGHHVQNHAASQSPFRIGRVAAVDGASRLAMFCGGTLAEGWACYATDLMEEHGFLSDLERVAQQHTRVRQLARAVVDIELHQKSLTLDEAQWFYQHQAGLTPAAARTETIKNSMFPGTAIMYWLGTEGIHRLRGARQTAEGAGFTLRRFHDHLLGYGAVPVALIAELFQEEDGG